MAGSGMRGARYLQQAGADVVWVNDYNPKNQPALTFNMSSALLAARRNDLAHTTQQASDTQASPNNHQDDATDAAPGEGEGTPLERRVAAMPSTTPDQVVNDHDGSSDHQSLRQLPGWQSLRLAKVRPEGLRNDVCEWSLSGGCDPSPSDPDAAVPLGALQPFRVPESRRFEFKNSSALGVNEQQQPSDRHSDGSSKAGEEAHPSLPPQHLNATPPPPKGAKVDEPPQEASTSRTAARLHDGSATGSSEPAAAASCASQRLARISQVEANRLLCSCYLSEDFYDLVDVDSFGRCCVDPHWDR